MAGITLAEAEAQLAVWLQCLQNIATGGQSTTQGGRTFTEANLREVREMVDYWETKVTRLAASGGSKARIRIRGITPA